jgi:hypothetical protein
MGWLVTCRPRLKSDYAFTSQKRFCSINPVNAKTEEELSKGGMSELGKRFNCIYHEVKKIKTYCSSQTGPVFVF